MADRPLLYELPTWRDPPGYQHAVTVAAVLADLARLPGGVPATLATEQAVKAFAAAVDLPLCDLDIEPDLHFPQIRWASRAWARAEYLKFHAWLTETGWLGAKPTPPARKRREPAVA